MCVYVCVCACGKSAMLPLSPLAPIPQCTLNLKTRRWRYKEKEKVIHGMPDCGGEREKKGNAGEENEERDERRDCNAVIIK